MANITESVKKIREAIYGKDVRESIAAGIEAINAESQNAKESAETAASNAQKAANDAESAISTAATATVMASEAAGKANTAAETAAEKAQAAQTAADGANTAAEAAQAAKEAATTAAELANSKAAAAETAAGQAGTAAQEAQEAKTAANTAAAAANTAAETAQTQGNYAKTQGDRAAQLLEEIEDTDVGGMAADILALQSGKADLVNGKVPDAQLPELDFDPAGSAAAVQEALAAHTGSQANPHSVTAEQAGAVPTTRKVNGLPLSSDITLNPWDIGTYSAAGIDSLINGKEHKTCVVIGTTASGHNSNDCDYLCDGVNDQDVIQAAIDEVVSNASIFFLKGSYYCSSEITLNSVNQGIKLFGNNASLVRGWHNATNTKTGVIVVNAENCEICNLEFSVDPEILSSIDLKDTFINSGSAAIGLYIHHNVFHENILYSVYASKSSHVVVGFNSIINTSGYSRNYGFYFSGTNSCLVLGNTMPYCEIVIESCKYHNVCLNTAMSVSFSGTSSKFTEESYIASNVFEGGSSTISMSCCIHCRVIGNRTPRYGNCGFSMGWYCKYNLIDENDFTEEDGSSYSSNQFTIRVGTGTETSEETSAYNLFSNNLIYGKNYVQNKGAGNTFTNNKYN